MDKEQFKKKLKYGDEYCEKHDEMKVSGILCFSCIDQSEPRFTFNVHEDVAEDIKKGREKMKHNPQWYTEYNKQW